MYYIVQDAADHQVWFGLGEEDPNRYFCCTCATADMAETVQLALQRQHTAQSEYARTVWRVEDLQTLADVTDDKAAALLSQYSRYLEDDMTQRGWETLRTCLSMDGYRLRDEEDEEPQEYTEANPHHYFRFAKWQYQVEEGATNRSYNDWVHARIEETEEELEEAETDFDNNGGRGVELAEIVDELRGRLDPEHESNVRENEDDIRPKTEDEYDD